MWLQPLVTKMASSEEAHEENGDVAVRQQPGQGNGEVDRHGAARVRWIVQPVRPSRPEEPAPARAHALALARQSGLEAHPSERTAAAATPAPPDRAPGGSKATAISRPTCRTTRPRTSIAVSASSWSAPSIRLPIGRCRLEAGERVAQAGRADVAERRARGRRARGRRWNRQPRGRPALAVPLEQRRALRLDVRRAGPPAAVGEEGEAGTIDPADPRPPPRSARRFSAPASRSPADPGSRRGRPAPAPPGGRRARGRARRSDSRRARAAPGRCGDTRRARGPGGRGDASVQRPGGGVMRRR